MARSNFVRNDVDKLDLNDGDFIVVKRELNLEEDRRVLAKTTKSAIAGEKVQIDLETLGIAKAIEYIEEWGGPGFLDDTGKVVPFSPTTLNNLRPEKFKEISDAIDAHEEKQHAARVAEKNDQGGESKSSATSPSVAG